MSGATAGGDEMPAWERAWLLADEHLAAVGDAPWWELAGVNPDDLTAEEWAEACAAREAEAMTTGSGRRARRSIRPRW